MKKVSIILSAIFLLVLTNCSKTVVFEQGKFDEALENGKLSNEGYKRCLKFTEGWLEEADSTTGLIPRNLQKDTNIWNAKDAAADNYPFMVLTAYLLDKDLYNGTMRKMLGTEKALTSRVGTLPDTYSFEKRDFEHPSENMERIIFGSSEYIKDGLLPITELIGESPWSDRMIEILIDLSKHVDVVKKIDWEFYGNAPIEELNGEFLQILSRIYWMTGDEKLLDWAVKIGDHYLMEDHLPTEGIEYLRIRDHGCEIISGLCELYVCLHFARPEKKKEYSESIHKMLDRILETGRNEDGLFYNAINPITGEVVDSKIADTWGYTLNGYYSIFLIDGKKEYRDAVLRAFDNLDNYRNYLWEGESSDGYADAIESALNLYNREAAEEVASWIDSEIKVMWNKQQESGIIEGWHGDGNFARTTLMYCLWKTQGLTVQPWRQDLQLGAVKKGNSLLVALTVEKDWEGKLLFDKKRHKEILKLPIDYPRINQFPEWMAPDPKRNYELKSFPEGSVTKFSGADLENGLQLKVKADEPLYLEIVELL